MAMLQRRFASSIYAVRRSLERMKDKREKILDDPEGYRQEQINKRLPEDFDDLPEEEQQEIIAELEERGRLRRPGRAARGNRRTRPSSSTRPAQLEKREVESKLVKLQRAPHRPGHLRRPEDEAAHLHRAQGHARLPGRRRQGRPAPGQAPASGACRSPRSTAA